MSHRRTETRGVEDGVGDWHVIYETGAPIFEDAQLREQSGLLPFGSAMEAREADENAGRVGPALELVRPVKGWVPLRNASDRALVAPGGLQKASAFRYEVIYESGAFVRDGKELSARHVHTFPRHSILDVFERCINEQGLARLQIKSPNHEGPIGWISERLNPMSGQRGPICRPLPMVCPLVYRVVFAAGAVVRADVELVSRKVSVLPYNRVVVVSEKCFSHHPGHRCVPRLRLADGSGWISLRTNDPPSQAREIMRLVGCEEAAATRRTAYAYDALRQHWEEGKRGDLLRSESEPSSHSRLREEQTKRFARAMKQVHTAPEDPAPDESDVSCLICFDQCRNATIVHKSSGHICSCLDCARLLCARGDPCPVCREPIDNVIENFWARPMVPQPALLKPSSFAFPPPPVGTADLLDLEAEHRKLTDLTDEWFADAEAADGAPWHVIATEGADLHEESTSSSDDLSQLQASGAAPILNFENPIATLPFGTLVLATRTPADGEVLRIVQPLKGFAYIRSLSGKCLFRPGGLEEGARWHFEVTYSSGAYVREGVELSSRHTHTFPVHDVVEARGRCFNSQNLARLQILNSESDNNRVIGWISEVLNPISAQHGAIVAQVPMVAPLMYRVTYPDGAVVRAGIELESENVGHIPAGQVVTVVEKIFSEQPTKRCVPRLKLADGAGWISQRLNAILEADSLEVVELIGPHPRGAVARMQAKRVIGFGAVTEVAKKMGDLSIFGEEGWVDQTDESAEADASGSKASPSPSTEEPEADATELCAVCGVAPRTATLIHEEFGRETGHVVVCVPCGNQLKLLHRGCPVCSMPIESVNQHFWA